MGYRATLPRVSMAFHSPVTRVIHDELEEFIALIKFHPPQIPVISNTTMAPYPSDPGEIRRILMAHLESPVHWMNNVQTLWNDYGVRLFVEARPGRHIEQSHRRHDLRVCMHSDLAFPAAESLTCKTAIAQLFVHGHLKVQKEPGFVSFPGVERLPDLYLAFPRRPRCNRGDRAWRVSNPKEAIVQREINRFVLETFGRFLKPDILEAIRHATGFERDEIQPDMDLKRDLSIRSSRLPIIMVAVEQHFGITIELQDFINVRTVKDIAQRISEIIARQEGAGQRPVNEAVDQGAVLDEIVKPSEDEASLKRLVLNQVAARPAGLHSHGI